MNSQRVVRFFKILYNVIDDIWRISAWENCTWAFQGENDKTAFQKKKANVKAKAKKESGTFKDK